MPEFATYVQQLAQSQGKSQPGGSSQAQAAARARAACREPVFLHPPEPSAAGLLGYGERFACLRSRHCT